MSTITTDNRSIGVARLYQSFNYNMRDYYLAYLSLLVFNRPCLTDCSININKVIKMLITRDIIE